LGRRVHELEFEEIVDIEAFEQEDYVGQVCALDLRDVVLKEVLPEHSGSIQPEAGARPSPSSPA
jgi:hypothetical protein